MLLMLSCVCVYAATFNWISASYVTNQPNKHLAETTLEADVEAAEAEREKPSEALEPVRRK